MRLLIPTLLLLLLTFACADDAPLQMLGTLERDRLELTAERSEPIVDEAVAEGDCLQAEDLILELDPARVDHEIAAARADQAAAEARVAELERGPRSERRDAARAELAGAEQAVDLARLELQRASALYEEGVQPRATVDQRREQLASATAGRDAAQARLLELERGSTSEEIAQARAVASAATHRADELTTVRDRLAVRAPRAACLESFPFEIGEKPAAGATVAVLLASGPPWARIYVPEPLRARVKAGTRFDIHVDGFERSFSGRVRSIAGEPAFTPHFALTERDRSRLSYLAKVELDGSEAVELPAGLPLQATLAGARP